MSSAIVQIPNAAAIARRNQNVVAKLIRFVSDVPPEAKVLRTFQHPRRCVAIEETIETSALVLQGVDHDDGMLAVLASSDGASEAKKLGDLWMNQPSGEGELAPVVFTANGQKIQWRPGKTIIQAPAEDAAETLSALVEFAFYESELRRMDRELVDIETLAPADVSRAHRIRFRDRKHWKRIGDTIERLYRMRLEYARLESQLIAATVAMSRDVRQIVERLIEETGIYDRMEAFSNRLEACEDLYEGANDRIADHRWYVEGHLLEIGIVLLLVLEVVLISTDLYMKHWK